MVLLDSYFVASGLFLVSWVLLLSVVLPLILVSMTSSVLCVLFSSAFQVFGSLGCEV